MLIFAKLSLISFIYEMIETFYFPNEKAKKMFGEYKIEYVFSYHVLTDTESTCLFSGFVCKPECDVLNEKFRN